MKGREKSFADPEWENKKHKTKREKLPEKMEVLMPWEKMLAQIKPYYGCAGKGRVPYPLESMLRVHCVQLFYNLSDPGGEDLLYEAESVRRLTGLEMGKLPDESTILNCRHQSRASRVGDETVGDRQRASIRARIEHQRRNHNGCQHHCVTRIDKESVQGA